MPASAPPPVQPVFIGGTGRSGTTILARTLGMHPACYVFRTELRFFTDPDGLLALRQAFVDGWSPFRADMAVERFRALMADLKARGLGRYPNSSLGDELGSEAYDRAVDSLLSKLVAVRYHGAWAGRTNIWEKMLLRALPGWRGSLAFALKEIAYGPRLDPERFGQVAREFVQDLVSAKHARGGWSHFVDHTPFSILHADFLADLLPNMRLIHVLRDPRDVVASYRTQDWAPTDTGASARMVRDILDRWDEIRARIPPQRYVEIRFEDFIDSPRDVLEQVCGFLGLELHERMLSLDLSRHHIGRWKQDLAAEERTWIEEQGLVRRWQGE